MNTSIHTPKELDEGSSGPPSPSGSVGELIDSEGATGHGSVGGQELRLEEVADNVSDAAWDTDLEIEGLCMYICRTMCWVKDLEITVITLGISLIVTLNLPALYIPWHLPVRTHDISPCD